ncbi:MAG: aminopeptidase P N-terminal domain-containing protein [Opitutaceae bacterium]
MSLFDHATLTARLHRITPALAAALGDSLVLVHAGLPVSLPENTDQTYPFLAHSEYFYLTGLECAGGIVAFDPREAGAGAAAWHSFVPELTESERIWEGRTQAPGELMPGLVTWLHQRPNRPVVHLGAPPADRASDPARVAAIREVLKHERRPKDAAELTLLRRAAECTAAGYTALVSHLQPGVSERSLQIELEAGFFRAGATGTGYGSIVGSGPNAAVLHFDPSSRVLNAGEFVLVDAGARVSRYVCDITRTYVVGQAPTPFQRDLHRLVLEVEEAAIARCRPGAEWKNIHLQAAVQITSGLIDLGLMRGRAENLVEREAHTLFFPHGLGHLVGLGVRDASGTPPGRSKDPRPSLRTLRTDLPLAEGYVITVEPGIYFIPTLLEDPVRRERYADCVHWDRADALIGTGGVRIEDNLHITSGAPENLTAAIPKTL